MRLLSLPRIFNPGVRRVAAAVDFYRFSIAPRDRIIAGTSLFLLKFFSARSIAEEPVFSSRVPYFIRGDRLSTISGKASRIAGTAEDDNGRYGLRWKVVVGTPRLYVNYIDIVFSALAALIDTPLLLCPSSTFVSIRDFFPYWRLRDV